MAVLGVIPARGGSKRFPGKNLANFKGRPLIAWSILAGHKSSIDDLIVSTDDIEIELTAIAYGCKVLKRPPELATDAASSESVLRHAIGVFRPQYVVLLQPTSPLRTAWDINAALKLFHVEHQTVISYRPDGTKNGAVYVCSTEWLENHNFTDEHLRYWMPWKRSLDIDYPKDIDDFLSGHRSS